MLSKVLGARGWRELQLFMTESRVVAANSAELKPLSADSALRPTWLRLRLPLLRAMVGSRLCQRVALAIFLCLVAVATIFQGPTYRDRERGLEARLEQSALASVETMFRLIPANASPEQVIASAPALLPGMPLKGGILYAQDGRMLGAFGEKPDLPYRPGAGEETRRAFAKDLARLDVIWTQEQIGAPYVLAARLDSSAINPQLQRFLFRVGLVALAVALAVTAVTMVILGLTVLAPILELRQRLGAAGADLEHADRHAISVKRRDELGDVLEDFNRLLGHVARSIAELRQSHAEVRASEERWHRIFDSSADAILIVCRNTGRIIEANETAVRLFEYPRADLLQLSFAALEGEKSCLSQMVDKADREGHAASYAVSCISRSGRRILAEAHLATLPIGPGRPMLLVVRDMTERRLAEEALRLSQRRLAGILDIAQDAIISVDDTFNIRLFNKGAERTFGFAAYEAIGRPLELLLSDYRSLLAWIEAGSSTSAERFEVRARRKDGEEFPAELTSSKFKLGDETVFTIILRDVSDRRRAELERGHLLAQFHQAQKMEAMGRLAGGIAHDFNNVLAAILGYADLALYDLPPDTPATVNVHQVLKAARRGKTLVRQILAFSRREEKVERPIEMNKVLTEVIDLLSATLPKSIELERRITAPTAVVRGDEAELHQLIMNLCVNAAQAIGQEPGHILIELDLAEIGPAGDEELRAGGTQLRVGTLVEGPYLRLAVTDTGIGMSEDTVSHMFEPFFTTKPKGEGTGLGLAAVHGIVTARGGAIAVRTAPGQGTGIEVFLPRSGEEEDFIAEAPKAITGAGERVLFIDDEPDLTDIGRQSLERLGYRCDTMSNAAAALAAFRADPDRWSAIITDHMMPGMTGEAMAREILAIRPDMPIIMCTGFGDTITSDTAKVSGIREFVMKPVSGRELAEIVSRVLRPRTAP
jgi:PAS domain S-box-containing protein